MKEKKSVQKHANNYLKYLGNKMKKPKEIPEDLKYYLGQYGEQIFDGWSGLCVGWGYRIVHHCGDEVWAKLAEFGEKECIVGGQHSPTYTWFLITEWLSIESAIEKYGAITQIMTGPRGGFRSIRFGDTPFIHDSMDPRGTKHFDEKLVVIER